MDVSGPFLRTDHDGRLSGKIDGFYITRLTIVEKVPIFSNTFIQVLSTPCETYVCVLFRGQWGLVPLLEETKIIINKFLSEL